MLLVIVLTMIISVATAAPGTVLTQLLPSDPERQELEKRMLQHEI
ncbi:hypothetical protein [Rufibacter tibetensis]|nr:hypothetical protein [Rufibacter tibetensis]